MADDGRAIALLAEDPQNRRSDAEERYHADPYAECLHDSSPFAPSPGRSAWPGRAILVRGRHGPRALTGASSCIAPPGPAHLLARPQDRLGLLALGREEVVQLLDLRIQARRLPRVRLAVEEVGADAARDADDADDHADRHEAVPDHAAAHAHAQDERGGDAEHRGAHGGGAALLASQAGDGREGVIHDALDLRELRLPAHLAAAAEGERRLVPDSAHLLARQLVPEAPVAVDRNLREIALDGRARILVGLVAATRPGAPCLCRATGATGRGRRALDGLPALLAEGGVFF